MISELGSLSTLSVPYSISLTFVTSLLFFFMFFDRSHLIPSLLSPLSIFCYYFFFFFSLRLRLPPAPIFFPASSLCFPLVLVSTSWLILFCVYFLSLSVFCLATFSYVYLYWLCCFAFVFLVMPRTPRYPLFPYQTLCRSCGVSSDFLGILYAVFCWAASCSRA